MKVMDLGNRKKDSTQYPVLSTQKSALTGYW